MTSAVRENRLTIAKELKEHAGKIVAGRRHSFYRKIVR